MKRSFACVLVFSFLFTPGLTQSSTPSDAKQKAVASIDRQSAEMGELSDQIWAFAEIALRETRSATLLADYAEAQGFAVERGVAEMSTAFVASYGKGQEFHRKPRPARKRSRKARRVTAVATTCSGPRVSPPRSRSRN